MFFENKLFLSVASYHLKKYFNVVINHDLLLRGEHSLQLFLILKINSSVAKIVKTIC